MLLRSACAAVQRCASIIPRLVGGQGSPGVLSNRRAFSCGQALYRLGHRHPHAMHFPCLERGITVNTCKDLYNAWRGRYGYWDTPTDGINLTVSYVHSAMDRKEKNDNSKRPLALLLPGNPGTYKDFGYTSSFLLQNCVDVVALNWPDTSVSRKTNFWWHSSEEKSQLTFDFLKALRINELDMVISHSSSSYVALRLVTSQDVLKSKSLALLNPAPHKMPRCMKPTSVIFGFGRMFQDPKKRDLASVLFRIFLTLIMHPVKRDMDNVFMSTHTMMLANIEQFRKDLETLVQMRLPTLITMSDNDKLMDVATTLKMAALLGRTPDTFWYYDANENVTQEGKDDFMKIIRFKRGSHYSFSHHSDITNDAILEVLDQALVKK